MRPTRRMAPRPLARPEKSTAPRAKTSTADLTAEIRVHFPGFEEELRRQHDLGFEIFPESGSGSVYLLGILIAAARIELARRIRFAAAHLFTASETAPTSEDVAAIERLAIQNEDQEVTGGSSAADEARTPADGLSGSL